MLQVNKKVKGPRRLVMAHSKVFRSIRSFPNMVWDDSHVTKIKILTNAYKICNHLEYILL